MGFQLYKSLEKCRLLYSDRKWISGYLRDEGQGGQERTSGDRNILDPAWGGGSMDGRGCHTEHADTWQLRHVSDTAVKLI